MTKVKELLTAGSVLCSELQEILYKGERGPNPREIVGVKTAEAYIQTFRDGSTKVFCDEFNSHKKECISKRKSTCSVNDAPCTFYVDPTEK